MSRVAKKPITLPKGVEVKLAEQLVQIKGAKGALDHKFPRLVTIKQENDELLVSPVDDSTQANVLAGTTRALVNNIVVGVSHGYDVKLQLVGVGYRALVKGHELHLTLGFSHPVVCMIPKGLTVECPSQTEIIVKGIDKQQVGQFAANIRSYRPPEPYKGKGVRYANEVIILKETKKK